MNSWPIVFVVYIGIVLSIVMLGLFAVVRVFKSRKMIHTAVSEQTVAQEPILQVQKAVIVVWSLLTLLLLLTEDLQKYGAVIGFFLFVYVVWFGLIRPTLKKQ